MIVATAGHIDHGKTVLVKALTGVDTDRLPEEKQRGMSIDLGFAYAPLGGGEVLGFVDVPGHERFVRNMIAGVTGIDFALLVIAADDGPMPQTREHLAILDLFGIGRGAVALTKTDRVDEARIAEAGAEIGRLVAATCLEGAPVFPLAALTGEGVPALRQHLDAAAAELGAREAAGNFRLAIDRSFSVEGAGMVVTGAVFSGTVKTGDRLVISPAGTQVRVRGIHAQNRDAELGIAGQRCALNITAQRLGRDDAGRGDWIVAEAAHAPTGRFDARIRVLPGEDKALRHWTPVHVHLGAADIPGRVAVLEGSAIAPGEQGLVQIVLDHETAALRNDRFILRDQSAWRTIAGGRVIDPFAPARGRARPARLEMLAAMQTEPAESALAALLEISPAGLGLARFATSRNLTPQRARALYEGAAMKIAGDGDDATGFAVARWDELSGAARAALGRAHEERPDRQGMPEKALHGALGVRLPEAAFGALIDTLTASGTAIRAGGNVRLAQHRAKLSDTDAPVWQRIAPLFEDASRPPGLQEMADAAALPVRGTEQFLNRAARLGLVVRVAPNRFFTPDKLRTLGEMAEALAAEADDGMFSAAMLRDRSGIGRNITIEVVEYFDRVGFTRRSGNARSVLKPADQISWARN